MADEITFDDIENALVKGEAKRLGVPEINIRMRRLIETQSRESDEMNIRHAKDRRMLIDRMSKGERKSISNWLFAVN